MADISYLTRISFDFGALQGLGAELDALQVRRALLVTDPGLAKSGMVERVGAAASFAAIFADTPPNPTEAAVQACTALYREERCDGIVALGGGSSMDLAKAVALLATHHAPLESYAAIRGGLARITSSVAPLIAIPTTAGTGSEVGRGALITLASGIKLALISPHLIPKRAICDPELTLGLPRMLTAATGIDALTHCFETFLSPLVNPPAEAIALDGGAARLALSADRHRTRRRPRRALADDDGRARRRADVPEGTRRGACAVACRRCDPGSRPASRHLERRAAAVRAALQRRFRRRQYARLKQALGLAPDADLAGEVTSLLQRLGLPVSLGAMGFREDHIAGTVARALEDHSNATTPRPAGATDYETLLRDAL